MEELLVKNCSELACLEQTGIVISCVILSLHEQQIWYFLVPEYKSKLYCLYFLKFYKIPEVVNS